MIPIFTKPLIVAFFISSLTTPLVIKLFIKMGWLDSPKKNKKANTVHTYPTPRGGGLPIFLAILITALIFIHPNAQLTAILIATLIALLVGIVDDVFDINPYLRFGVNIFIAIIIVNSGIKIAVISNPLKTPGVIHINQLLPSSLTPILGADFLSKLVSVTWLVWCMNIVGWAGGVEGQLPGFIAIAATIIGILGGKFGQDIAQWSVIALAGTVAGAYLGFLLFNFYPQKIMPGYSGKSIGGLMLGILAILSGAKVATAILVLGIPMIDGILAIIRRLYRRKLPFWGDAEHFHHLLLKLGMPKAQVAILYWIFSIVLGAIVINLNSQQKLYAFIILFILFVSVTLIIRKIIKSREK